MNLLERVYAFVGEHVHSAQIIFPLPFGSAEHGYRGLELFVPIPVDGEHPSIQCNGSAEMGWKPSSWYACTAAERMTSNSHIGGV